MFKVIPTKHYMELKDFEIEDIEGNTRFVTTTVTDNGVKSYSKLEPNNEGNVITYSDTTTSEAIFYQSEPFIGRSHVQKMIPKFEMTKDTAMYIITSIRKSSKGLYSYSHKFNRTRMNDTDISLPVKQDGTPDYEYMERYVSISNYKYMRTLGEYINDNKLNNHGK